MYETDQQPLLQWRLMPLWFGLFLVAAVPFLSILRVGPLPSFFLETGSLLFALLLVLFAAFSGCLNVRLPRASWYFWALALFWAAQGRLMDVIYTGQNDMAAWSFAILGLATWGCRGWAEKVGWERAVSVLAWVLVLGACANAAVGWMQYTDAAARFSSWLMYRPGIVEGQLGQRNHFGHYLMWGVLAAGFLWSQRRLAWWLALPVLLFLAATMGLTGSRTIFAYLLGLALLLPVSAALGGRGTGRTLLGLTAAALLVCAGQFAIEPLLTLFQNSNLSSAAERLSGSSFGGSGRNYEWRKAWQIFLSAPWFGYGWGSYSLQGFLIDVYPNGFRPYEGNVLFTHSHNSLLNLLAEMGLAGTLLVLGGLAWVVSGCLKKPYAAVGMFLLALLSVSLIHSLLEYPLWYVYFLSVFALFLGFMPGGRADARPDGAGSPKNPLLRNAAGAAAALLLIGGIVRLGFAYQDLREFSRTGSGDTTVQQTEKMVGLLTLSKTEPMLAYYADYQLMTTVDPNDAAFPEWVARSAEALRYRPFSNAYKWALVAYRNGKHEAAAQWMAANYRYYPTKFSALGSAVMLPPYYPGLREGYRKDCRRYYDSIRQVPQCTQAASETFGANP